MGSLPPGQACPSKYRQKVLSLYCNSIWMRVICYYYYPYKSYYNDISRFIVLRGSSGFYSYAIYEHLALPEWPGFSLGETRIAFKLRKEKYNHSPTPFLSFELLTVGEADRSILKSMFHRKIQNAFTMLKFN